jgi:uncharacterized protein
VGAATKVIVEINGKAVEDSDVLAFTVERDMGQPDMAAIVLSNQEATYSTSIEVEQSVQVKVGDDKKVIYIGEVVGLEANYRGGEKARLTVRAMNKMHRLLRKRKSVTFTNKDDAGILKDVAKDAAGLDVQWKHKESVDPYKHVYQHNQTAMEFIRMRAARMGCHVWCVDKTLYVQEPDLDQSPVAELKVTESGDSAVRAFTPRLSSAAVVNKVTVKGWNPETKELITGEFSMQGSNLGSETAVAGSKNLGKEETFTVDHPIWDPKEAKALAKARLNDAALSFITGECEISGDPQFDLGTVVKIIASAESSKSNDPFNGDYYIMGITHRYALSKTKDGGYITVLRLARNMQKPKG